MHSTIRNITTVIKIAKSSSSLTVKVAIKVEWIMAPD